MKNQFMNFEDARKFVRSLKLKNFREWKEYCRSGNKPFDIPSGIHIKYKNDGFISTSDFLGCETIAPQSRDFLTFEKARKYVQKLHLKSISEWREFCKSGKKPDNIPSNAHSFYKTQGWITWGDWLGSGTIAHQNKNFLSFAKAKKYASNLKLKSKSDWYKFCKTLEKPQNIPTNPSETYKNNGWTDWGDWLGTGTIAPQNKKFLPFNEARRYVQGLKLKSQTEWGRLIKTGKLPPGIPSNLRSVYPKQWKGWGDWLGTGNIASRNRKYKSFEDGKKEAKQLGLKYNIRTQADWVKASREGKIPKHLPANPWHVYRKGRKKNEKRV